MKDSEFYPVSFFSSTFDLLQKVRNGFYALEAEQVEMFALQMKRHQDLIMSIHQQMRNIESISESKTSFEMPKPTIAPEQVRQAIKDYVIMQNTGKKAIKSENTQEERPRKTSIFNRIIGKDNVQAPTTFPEPVKPEKKEVLKPIENKNNITVIPTPVVIPAKKLTETKPKEVPITQEKIRITEEKYHKAENNVLHQPRSLNDVIEKSKLSDLRKAFNLNDRFRYQRELFGGKEDAMSKVITELNGHHSLKESLTYLKEKLGWDVGDPTVNDFIKKLEIRFL
jgi:hypothetical protein